MNKPEKGLIYVQECSIGEVHVSGFFLMKFAEMLHYPSVTEGWKLTNDEAMANTYGKENPLVPLISVYFSQTNGNFDSVGVKVISVLMGNETKAKVEGRYSLSVDAKNGMGSSITSLVHDLVQTLAKEPRAGEKVLEIA